MTFKKPAIGLSIVFAALLAAFPAQAYIGPGAGLSAIGTAVAVVGAFLLLIVGFVWYPVKRFLRNRKGAEPKVEEQQLDQQQS